MHDLGSGVFTWRGALRIMPATDLPLCATALRATNGDVVLISPIDGIGEWGPELESIGPVRHVVAPNGLHHLYAKPAWERYGEATLWASAALRKKRPDFPESTRWLEGSGPVELAPGVRAYPVLGMPAVQEWVFLHEPSGTLVVTDLVFNVLDPAFMLGVFQRMFGTYRKLAVSRLFTSARKDRAAYDASLATIVALPFDRLVMAHGEPVLNGAHARFEAAIAAGP